MDITGYMDSGSYNKNYNKRKEEIKMIKNKLFTSTAALVLGAVILTGCTEAEIEKVEAPEAEQETTEVEETEPAEVQDLRVGDVIEYNDLKVTLNSVRKYEGSADTFDEAQNDFYLVFDVIVENMGDEPANISSMLNFNLLDGESYAQDFGMLIDQKGSLDGEIGNGRKLAGEVVFDVVQSDKYEFIFEDPFAGGQAIWVIEAGDFE